VDPLAGSYYVERLTGELEERATALLQAVDEMGGAEQAIARGFFQEEIAKSAYALQLRIERGESVIVGVNKFTDDAEPMVVPAPDYSRLEREQVERLAAARAARDAADVTRALGELGAAADYGTGAFAAPVMPNIVAAVRARATLGEISDALSAAWGLYRPS
jgi:methylmalonyl-CoA mutase N-terminal domain/subunit